jgi:hypothetical protein
MEGVLWPGHQSPAAKGASRSRPQARNEPIPPGNSLRQSRTERSAAGTERHDRMNWSTHTGNSGHVRSGIVNARWNMCGPVRGGVHARGASPKRPPRDANLQVARSLRAHAKCTPYLAKG